MRISIPSVQANLLSQRATLTWVESGTIIRGDMDGNGRFAVYFAMDIWGEGRGEAPLPPMNERGRMWKEWFQL